MALTIWLAEGAGAVGAPSAGGAVSGGGGAVSGGGGAVSGGGGAVSGGGGAVSGGGGAVSGAGGAGSVTGFIQTDGTLGTLSSNNITDWTLTLAAPNLSGGSPEANAPES